MKTKIAIIIASKNFRDEEYFVTKEVLENKGYNIKTVSDKKNAIGKLGGEAVADLLIQDLNVDEFDSIIFAGGPGAMEFLDNEISYNICQESIKEGKVLAAICISPAILAKAGVLKDKRATVWSSNMDKSAISILKENGAIYNPGPVVVDENIITANGPDVAEEFALNIDKILKTSSI